MNKRLDKLKKNLNIKSIFTIIKNDIRTINYIFRKNKEKTFASRISIPKKTSDGGKEYIYQEGGF